MKTKNLSIKELAAIIGVSTDTIGEPFAKMRFRRHGSGLRYGLIYTKSSRVCSGTRRPSLGHAQPARRAAVPATRRATRPRLVTRGHYPQGLLQEV
jgi:hypothetical protein